MWDPTCLVSPACEETRSIYRLSTPPTPLLDEPMPSPQKPSPAKERLQTVTEEVEVTKEVTVKKETRKVQSRSELLAQALEQARISSPAIAKSKTPPATKPSPDTPSPAKPALPLRSPSLLRRESPPLPKFPLPPLLFIPVMAVLAGTPRQCSRW